MNEFVSIEILGTIAGCSLIITLLTQVFKKYLPEKIDTKWLALAFSIIVGVLRIIYLQQYDFNGLVAGIFNIFVLLSAAIGIHEIVTPTVSSIKTMIAKGGNENEEKK
jgi:hypothetical protein